MPLIHLRNLRGSSSLLHQVVASDLQRTLIGYTSASSACSKAMQWVAALQLLEDHVPWL